MLLVRAAEAEDERKSLFYEKSRAAVKDTFLRVAFAYILRQKSCILFFISPPLSTKAAGSLARRTRRDIQISTQLEGRDSEEAKRTHNGVNGGISSVQNTQNWSEFKFKE
jgi:hypothetical protein